MRYILHINFKQSPTGLAYVSPITEPFKSKKAALDMWNSLKDDTVQAAKLEDTVTDTTIFLKTRDDA